MCTYSTNEKKKRKKKRLDTDPPRQRRTQWLAGSVSVMRVRHFLIELRRGRGHCRSPDVDVDLEAAMRIIKTSNKRFRNAVPDGCKRRPALDCRRGQTRPLRTRPATVGARESVDR